MEYPSSCLRWLNFSEHMLNIYYGIFQTHEYTDCRLVVPDGELYANRPILSMASSFFETIFSGVENGLLSTGTEMVTVLLPDLKLAALRSVLQFVYTGEVSVRPYEMAPFVEACSFLQIRGVRFVEDRIVGVRFGKAISLISDEPNPQHHATDSGECRTAEFCVETEQEREKQSNALQVPTVAHDFPIREAITTDPPPESGNESSEIAPDTMNVSPEPYTRKRSHKEKEELLPACLKAVHEFAEDQTLSGERSIVCNDFVPTETPKRSKTYTLNDAMNEELQANSVPPVVDLSSYEARLKAAIDAVINQGISYRIASAQYSIAKTVLWRKTMKMHRPVRASLPKMTNQRREAIDALKSGEKLVHVSRRFEIPLSTLHREKQRLYSMGILPSHVSLKLRGKDESVRKRLLEAVGECAAGKMSLSEAARVYGLPKTSIWRRVRSLQTCGTETKGIMSTVEQTDHLSIPGASGGPEKTMDDLLMGTDALAVGEVYLTDETISVNELAQLRIQLASSYDQHALNDSSQ
uniref:BTB domain-containing protein n=1 Tax=Anopheles epiroticus TaxID=199890 RepID=A0A182PB88_9DIPT